MMKNIILENKNILQEISSLLNTVRIRIIQNNFQIYIDLLEEFLTNKNEKKELFKIKTTKKKLWFSIYEGLLCKEHHGLPELIYRFILFKVNKKIRELL